MDEHERISSGYRRHWIDNRNRYSTSIMLVPGHRDEGRENKDKHYGLTLIIHFVKIV